MTRPMDDTLQTLRELVSSTPGMCEMKPMTGHLQLLMRIATLFDILDTHLQAGGYLQADDLPSDWERITRKRPRYTHDCNECKFLGTWEDSDLYYCEKADGGSVIARYGNEGHEYISCMIDYTKSLRQEKLHSTKSPALRVGVLIAEDMGLLNKPIREPHVNGYRIVDINTMKASKLISNERDAYRASCMNCEYESDNCLNSCPKEIVKIIAGGSDE